MRQDTINEVKKWLPELNPCDIDFQNTHDEESNLLVVNQATEFIRVWAESILTDANVPTSSSEAKSLIERFDPTSDEGCALRIIIELDAMQSSLDNSDAHTAAITGMKLFEAVWRRKLKRLREQRAAEAATKKTGIKKNTIIEQADESDENIKLYQKTINELKRKYPHCNVNALRLLASTRLNVTKQQLDDLDISPK